MTDYSQLDSHRLDDRVPGKIMKQPVKDGTFKRLAESKRANQAYESPNQSTNITRGSFSTLPSAVGTKDMKQSKLFQKFMKQQKDGPNQSANVPKPAYKTQARKKNLDPFQKFKEKQMKAQESEELIQSEIQKRNQRLAEEQSAFVDTKKKIMRSPRQTPHKYESVSVRIDENQEDEEEEEEDEMNNDTMQNIDQWRSDPKQNDEMELAGHSEQILGQPDLVDFGKYPDANDTEMAPKPRQYPDKSFVNQGDCFSVQNQQNFGTVPQQQEKPQSTFWPSQSENVDTQTQLETLQAQYEKDKKFYTEALEARTDQLEELE